MADAIEDSTPVHSSATAGFLSPPIETISAAASSGETSGLTLYIRARGQSSLANFSRPSLMSVMTMGSAPAAAEQRRVMRPMGPAPQTRTGSPSLTPARSIPARATLRGSRRAPFS